MSANLLQNWDCDIHLELRAQTGITAAKIDGIWLFGAAGPSRSITTVETKMGKQVAPKLSPRIIVMFSITDCVERICHDAKHIIGLKATGLQCHQHSAAQL
jgi:hypothetical protein